MIKMGYEERQIIKTVVRQNLQRPSEWSEKDPSQRAIERYRAQVKSALELFAVVVDPNQSILVMANTFAVAHELQESFKRAKFKPKKFQYISDRHQVMGADNCVVINVLQTRPCERYDAERYAILDYLRTKRDIDFWTFGDF
jgi:hypothetical protein